MKKKMSVFMALITFVLTACSSGIDGTYVSKSSGIDFTLMIENKDVSVTGETLIGNIEMNGTLNPDMKTMDLSGELLGIKYNESVTYELVNGKLELTLDGTKVVFEKSTK